MALKSVKERIPLHVLSGIVAIYVGIRILREVSREILIQKIRNREKLTTADRIQLIMSPTLWFELMRGT